MSCAYTVPRPVTAGVPIRRPALRRAAMACRCGQPLDLAVGGMHRLPGHHGTIPPIVCLDCVIHAHDTIRGVSGGDQ